MQVTEVDGKSNEAVLLLGHGSRRDEANDILRKVASTLKVEGGFGLVQPAFLEMESPNFHEALTIMVEQGFKDIKIMPYFLYMGNHMRKDLPKAIELGYEKYPDVTMEVTPNLGYHEKLIDIVLERIEQCGGSGAGVSVPGENRKESRTEAVSACGMDWNGGIDKNDGVGKEIKRHPIELESFRIIGTELGPVSFSAPETEILKRVIHTTADFEFKNILRFSSNAVEAGVEAFRNGANIITDVKMVGVGVSRERLAVFGSSLHCGVSDDAVIIEASKTGATRTATAMRMAADKIDGAIVAIGNAPTALRELLRLVREEGASPALVVGVPVGFVGAIEAKEELLASGVEYITIPGRKGGSTIAVSIINGLLIEAASRAPVLS